MAQAILRALLRDWFHRWRALRLKVPDVAKCEYRVNAVLVHHFHAITQYARIPITGTLNCFATDATPSGAYRLPFASRCALPR